MVIYAAFNSISVISRRQLTLFMFSCVLPVLGWTLKCLAQGHSHEKNPEDPVRPEPRTPGLRVEHFTTEPRRTLPIFCTLIDGLTDTQTDKLIPVYLRKPSFCGDIKRVKHKHFLLSEIISSFHRQTQPFDPWLSTTHSINRRLFCSLDKN